MTITFHPDIACVNGTAQGSVQARRSGKLLHAHTGNFMSDATRKKFARGVAMKAAAVPAKPDDGEKPAAYQARKRVAEVAQDELAATYADQLLGMLDVIRDRQDADEKDRAAADSATSVASGGGRPESPYIMTTAGISRIVRTESGGATEQLLTTFQARITEEVFRDDGVETELTFKIETRIGSEEPKVFSVPARSFGSMAWVTEKVGARGYMLAGRGIADHARAGIQCISTPVRHTVYCHTGWRQVTPGRWAYLTSSGATGADGIVPGVDVDLPEPLARFELPVPPAGDELIKSVRASLRLLDVADHSVTVPLYASLWRAVLGGSELAVGLFGRTGTLKSSLVAPFQQHLGAGMDKEHLPAGWSSTANALEMLASAAKDTFFVIDEYKPSGDRYEDTKLRLAVDRVIRGGVNGAGRQRLTRDSSMQQGRPARCLIAMTGEEIPTGESLRARMMVGEIKPGDIDKAKLAACQKDARDGVYAAAAAAYIRWLAPRYAEVKDSLAARTEQLRGKAAAHGLSHARTPEQVASLFVGLWWFFTFCVETGVMTATECDRLSRGCWTALCRVAGSQADHHAAEEPTERFIELLSSAIASGNAHLAAADGGPPPDPQVWGWRDDNAARKGSAGYAPHWITKGDRAGWIRGIDVFLDPATSFKAANGMAADSNRIPVAQATLHKRLADRGMIVIPENRDRRQELVSRVTLDGAQKRVLRLKPGVLSSVQPVDEHPEDEQLALPN
jgi:hypothetical protein